MPPASIYKRLALAYTAAINAYSEAALSPVERVSQLAMRTWDEFDSRLFRYHHYNYYYSNKAYSAIVRYAQQHRAESGLYRYTRSIYNPVYRLVELLSAKAFPGQVDWELMAHGALPFNRLNDAHRSAIRNLWKWSHIPSIKQRFPRDVARFGDGVIKVVDEPGAGKVRLQMLHPGVIADADITPQGYFDRVLIAYMRQDTVDEVAWLYEEEITKYSFATFRDGEPWGEYEDATGQTISSWVNPYGFVPVVLSRALELEHDWGAPPFFATIDKIDQVNDQASVLYDQVRKAVNPVFWLEGVSSMSQVSPQVVGDDGAIRDRIPIMLGPVGSKASPMLADINIADALEGIRMILEEIEKDHPELSLHRLRSGERVTGPGVLTAYDDAIESITTFRGAVDSGMLRAHQMALTIGGYRGYDGFEAFDLDSYARGDLDFEIAERPVLADNLTKKERLDLMTLTKSPARWVWEELGKTEEEIAEAEAEAEARAQEMAEALQGAGNEDDEGQEGEES